MQINSIIHSRTHVAFSYIDNSQHHTFLLFKGRGEVKMFLFWCFVNNNLFKEH